MNSQQDKSKDYLNTSPIYTTFDVPLENTLDSPHYTNIYQSLLLFDKYKDPNYLKQSAFKLYQNQNHQLKELPSKKSEVVRKHRGNYRKYTIEEKQIAVRQIIQGADAKQISQRYGIPRRNLLRWKKNGIQRKQGGGRPTDAEMEHVLYTKIDQKLIVTQKQIRNQAKKICKLNDFKASKGWYCKFSRRYNQWKRIQQQRAIQRGEEQKQIYLLPEVSSQQQCNYQYE